MLQPLDVGIFAALSIAYKNRVQRATRLGACYSIDETDFLELYRLAKQDAITSANIQKAWAATGLSPFDPQIVLKHFPPPEKPPQGEQYNITIRTTIPPEGTITRIGKDGETKVALTPANVLQVQQLLRQATAEGFELGEILEKVSKAAKFAIAQHAIQTITINELLELNKKERRANRAKGNWGNTRVMNQEIIDQRKKDAAVAFDKKKAQKALKELEKEERRLRALGPNIFAPPRLPATPKRRALATQISPPASLLRLVSPPPRRLPATLQYAVSPPQRRRRMVVILPVRVTTQDLQQGRWGQQRRH